MKTNPTDLDLEAATLFRPAPGVRLWMNGLGWGRSVEHHAFASADALDTDDHATQGVMLGQVEEAAGCTARLSTMQGLEGVVLHQIHLPGVGMWRDFTRAAVVVKAMVYIRAACLHERLPPH